MTPKIPVGQGKLILHVAEVLKGKTTTLGVPSASNQTHVPLAETTEVHRSAMEELVPTTTHVPVKNSAQTSDTNNPARTDIYQQHVSDLLEQQRLLLMSGFTIGSRVNPSQVSWNDQQIHLSSVAGKSTPNYLDICDFV